MKINHNISALNTYRNQQQVSKKVESSMGKLSSGQRIGQAADDSAGLAISEKMRGQIRGLAQASRNIDQGISLVQVADAALGSIADPNLLRLRELAVQAANDTLTDEDRRLLQQEAAQTLQGIDRIANDTEFNTIPLLNCKVDGSYIVHPGTPIPNFNFENVLQENAVAADGSFQFATKNGYPTTAADNDQILVYGNGSTSMPSVRIGNASFQLRASENTITPTVQRNLPYTN